MLQQEWGGDLKAFGYLAHSTSSIMTGPGAQRIVFILYCFSDTNIILSHHTYRSPLPRGPSQQRTTEGRWARRGGYKYLKDPKIVVVYSCTDRARARGGQTFQLIVREIGAGTPACWCWCSENPI